MRAKRQLHRGAGAPARRWPWSAAQAVQAGGDALEAGHTCLHLRASTAKDNIWTALKGDPNERIIDRFTRCIPPRRDPRGRMSPRAGASPTPSASTTTTNARVACHSSHGFPEPIRGGPCGPQASRPSTPARPPPECRRGAASDSRSWLQNRHARWLTRRRMRVATIGVVSAAFAVSTIGLSGSTPSPHRAAGHATGPKTAPVAAHPR